MSDENGFEPINVLLSREELTLILDLLQATSIPGLDTDPLGDMNSEQRTLAMIWAGRALRARELAQLNDAGELVVHHALLTAVGVCAYSSDALFIFHWPRVGDEPKRYFGHMRGEDIVSHTQLADVLHLFTLLPSREHLLNQVFDFCEYEDGTATGVLSLTVSNASFVRARELAFAGQLEAATNLLTAENVPADAATAFATTLASSPRVSILQTLKQNGEDTVQKSDFTIVRDDQYSWFLAPAQDDEAALVIKTTNKEEVENLLAELL